MKKDEHLNQIVTFLTDEQLAQLKRTSAMTGTPTSTLIRIAVADYLKNLPESLTERRNLPEQTL
jgi:Ribbon-helix-helix domain